MTIYPVILAGGSGTRLWPLSREYFPKQFLSLIGDHSLLQETLGRLEGLKGVARPVVVCNEEHRFTVAGQIREIGERPLAIIVEPVGRNTAPALTLASLRLLEIGEGSAQDPVMLVMPADHVVRDLRPFQDAVRTGASHAERGRLVTFGVLPDAPVTGYGYIRKGEVLQTAPDDQGGRGRSFSSGKQLASAVSSRKVAHRVSAFVEKPDLETAKAYLRAGDYLWNSGIFMMRASVWLSELERFSRDIAKACRAAQSNGHVDGDFYRPDAAEFIACRGDSIDYAVMEKGAGADEGGGPDSPSDMSPTRLSRPPTYVVVPLDAGWSDIGAWSALCDEREQDSQGNVIQGDVYAESTRNSLLISQHRLLASVGLEDVVVVETSDAVLVAHKGSVQGIKELVQLLKAEGRVETETHRKVHRPWGAYEIIDSGEGFQVKRLTVNVGAALSLQVHQRRAEHWVVVRGTARVTMGQEVVSLTESQSAYVPNGVAHRLENHGDVPLEVIEVQSGAYLGEDDIERLQDNYGRRPQE